MSWQKSYREENKLDRTDGKGTLAISAFLLSSLPTALHRKDFVKQIWESGADTIVSYVSSISRYGRVMTLQILIDHGTPSGFTGISEAREHLLRLGRRELESLDSTAGTKGTYVVAPVGLILSC